MASKPIRPTVLLQRRGRATLLWGAAALLLLQGGLRLAIDHCWPQLRDPTFETKAQELARLIANAPEPPVTVVMFGSSVTLNSFKAKDLEGALAEKLARPAVVVNMGSYGAGPLTELVWTRRLLQRGIRPDLVCIEVNPYVFNYDQPHDIGHFPATMLSESDLEVIERYSQDPNLRRAWGQDRWWPAYQHRLTILNYLARCLVPFADQVPTWRGDNDSHFWVPLAPSSAEELAEHLAKIRTWKEGPLGTFSPGRPSLQAFEELVGLLHSERIRTVLVLVPQSPTLRGVYDREGLKSFVRQVSRMGQQHGCTFIDAFDWLPEEQFGDGIHPDVHGAAAFSARLSARVLVPTLASTTLAQRTEQP
jgi:hypothetical protein